jgi:hypothetical protein
VSPLVPSSEFYLFRFLAYATLIIPLPNRTLVNAFPEAGPGVPIATDGCIYQSEVFSASTPPMGRKMKCKWGGRMVSVLVEIRLGIDDVDLIYYHAIKVRSVCFLECVFVLIDWGG